MTKQEVIAKVQEYADKLAQDIVIEFGMVEVPTNDPKTIEFKQVEITLSDLL